MRLRDNTGARHWGSAAPVRSTCRKVRRVRGREGGDRAFDAAGQDTESAVRWPQFSKVRMARRIRGGWCGAGVSAVPVAVRAVRRTVLRVTVSEMRSGSMPAWSAASPPRRRTRAAVTNPRWGGASLVVEQCGDQPELGGAAVPAVGADGDGGFDHPQCQGPGPAAGCRGGGGASGPGGHARSGRWPSTDKCRRGADAGQAAADRCWSATTSARPSQRPRRPVGRRCCRDRPTAACLGARPGTAAPGPSQTVSRSRRSRRAESGSRLRPARSAASAGIRPVRTFRRRGRRTRSSRCCREPEDQCRPRPLPAAPATMTPACPRPQQDL